MKTLSDSFIFKLVAVMLLSLSIVNCSKSSKKSSGVARTSASGYTTCPSNGYYISNGASYQCNPGSSVYTGSNTNTGYTTCPNTGYYTNNGQTYTCQPGTSVYSGGNTNTNTGSQQGYCTNYTAQYGTPYVLISYQGQYWCVRYDLSGGYQIIGY